LLTFEKFSLQHFHNPWSSCRGSGWEREMTWEIECGFVKWHQMCRVIRNKWKKRLTLPLACAFVNQKRRQNLLSNTELMHKTCLLSFRNSYSEILLKQNRCLCQECCNISMHMCISSSLTLLLLLLQQSLMNAKICIILEKVSRCCKAMFEY
jgi:hypothetical protein